MSPTPSTQVWFKDGTIVLQADQTLFRVYKGILAMNSVVFRDLFSYSHADQDEETYEGCPVLRIYDDPKELPHFLRALHDVRCSNRLCTSFESTVALLRLGTKYEVAHLRSKAIQTLALGFPTSLNTFDKGLPSEPFKFETKHAFTVVNLARQLDVPELLPAALYTVAMTSVARILLGFDQGAYSLDQESDKILCLTGREQILASRARYAAFLNGPSSRIRCVQPLVCEKERHRMHTELLSGSRDSPLGFCFRWESDVADTRLCLGCVDGMNPRPAECRRAFWDDLPSFFGLKGWGRYDQDDDGPQDEWACSDSDW